MSLVHAEFIAGEEGTYYYICTVPGHRDQGMVGEIIVSGSSGPAVAAAPTGVSHEFELRFYRIRQTFRTLAFDALPGEEGNNPQIIVVTSGDEVTITSQTMSECHSMHLVWFSNPDDFNSVIFDSAIAAATNPLKPGESGSTNLYGWGTWYISLHLYSSRTRITRNDRRIYRRIILAIQLSSIINFSRFVFIDVYWWIYFCVWTWTHLS